MTQKVMKLLDAETSLMQCRVCGAKHHAQIKPDSKGKYFRGNWQCQNSCKLGWMERLIQHIFYSLVLLSFFGIKNEGFLKAHWLLPKHGGFGWNCCNVNYNHHNLTTLPHYKRYFNCSLFVFDENDKKNTK